MEKAAFFANARRDFAGPMQGLRVVEATTTWAGPMCACILADFGADVIKIEHPMGEIARRSPPFLPDTDPPLSFMHATVNRNKRSLSLDLRSEGGREVMQRLIASTDIMIENFRPGTLSRWGLGYEALCAHKPDLIYVSISGYGQFGPDQGKVGYDPLAQASSGFLSLNGSPNGKPVKSPTFLADDLAGLHAALAAMAALRHRDQTGEGQWIDVALLDAMLFQSTGYLTLAAMDVELPRLGNEFRIAAPANSYECRDGSVMAGVLLDSHWRILCQRIGRPELAEHPDYATGPSRIAIREEVDGLLASWMQQHRVEEVLTIFADAGIPAAPVRSYAEAARDPHVLERDMLQATPQAEAASQALPITGPAAKFSRTPTRVRAPAPTLGAHNEEILRELGYDAAAIEALNAPGVRRS